MFAPLEDTVAAVKGWLTSSGIDASRILHYDNKGWLAFDATAEEAEGLFGAEFHEHEHSKSPSVRIGCDK
jgi:tripeptidyl-peptidase-1